MKTLLALLAFAGSLVATPVISNVRVDHIGHSTVEVYFHVTNASPDGVSALWSRLRTCWSATGDSAACAGGAGTVIPAYYPDGASTEGTSRPNRISNEFRYIVSGLSGSTITICPQVTGSGQYPTSDWSAIGSSSCVTFALNGAPADHANRAVSPTLPRMISGATKYSDIPAIPVIDGTFHSGASSATPTVAGAVTSCANLQSDIQAAVNNQTNYGTVISLAPGQASKCVGRFFPTGNPQDVHEFDTGNVDVGTSRITWTGHGLHDGDRVQFAEKYRRLPGELTTAAVSCTGIKPGEVYYVANSTTNDFQLSCEQPITNHGTVMRFADTGAINGGGAMYVAKYPRRKDQGGALWPVIIRTATPDAQLPPQGVRLDGPTYAAAGKLAVLELDALGQIANCTPCGLPFAFKTAVFTFGDLTDDGNNYSIANIWLDGLEIQTKDNTGDGGSDPLPSWALVNFKQGTSDNGLERCYVHGREGGIANRLAHGFSFEGHNNTVRDTWFDTLIYPFQATDFGWNSSAWLSEGTQFMETSYGPGPLFFYNNHLEGTGNTIHFNAAGENGFDKKHISDVVFYRNYMTQPMKYCYGSPVSDHFEYDNRQLLEFKGGFRILVDANTFDGECHNTAGTILAITAVTDGISDVTIRNNTWKHVASVANLGSSTQGGQNPQAPTSRYLFANNLVWSVNGCLYQDQISGIYAPAGAPFGSRCWNGWQIHAAGDGEDMIIRHNTIVQPLGPIAAFLWLGSEGADGLRVTDNFFNMTGDTSDGHGSLVDGGVRTQDSSSCLGSSGEAILTCAMMYPNSAVHHNVVTATQGISQATVSSFWPGQMVPATPNDISLLGFMDYNGPTQANPNFRLKGTSPYIRAASDGKAIGADIDALETAQGKVWLNGAVPSSTTATVNFVAPDTQACPVDVSTSKAGLITPVIRATDSGTAAGPRSVSITGLTAHTDYYFRVQCASDAPSGFFHTN